MTQVTPPGWYPDPGHTGEGPQAERWWDGATWTEHTRATGAPASGFGPAPYGQFGTQTPYGAPGPFGSPQPAKRRGPWPVGIAIGVVLLAVIGAGVFALARDDGDGGKKDVPAAAPSPDRSRAPQREEPSPGPSQDPQRGPQVEDGYVTDAVSGIKIPVPEGWDGATGEAGASVTTGEYACPGAPDSSCVHSGVFSAPAAALKISGEDPEAAAKADIKPNAEAAYGGGSYGTVSSHEEVASKAVTVAGQKGYLVRWKLVTSKGPDGYAQSVAFRSPTTGKLVMLRYGLDIGSGSPSQQVVDKITAGITAAAAGSGNGGNA